MTQQTKPRSLNDELSEAETSSEVHALLAKGETYEFATNRTRNRWRRIAKERLAQLKQDERRAA